MRRIEQFMKDNNYYLSKYKSNVIAVDFDGVIAEFTDDIETFGKIVPGAREALGELRSQGYKIIIHTARPSNSCCLENLATYLKAEAVPFDGININIDCAWESQKPLADLYIDDRACRFEGDWSKTLEDAKNLLGLNNNNAHFVSYDCLLSKINDRAEQVSQFEEFLRKDTNWLTAPASTRFHLPEQGGLVQHSINVANTLLTMSKVLSPEIAQESCVIVALYHDVGKVGYAGIPYYVETNQHTFKSKGVRYQINPDCPYMDIASRSVHLISKYMDLSPDEVQSIRYHDGQYIQENRSAAHRESRLTRLLQYADNWCAGVLEDRLNPEKE